MILEDFCRQVTQFQVNVLSSNRYKNLWTLPILESHTAQQVRRVHRYRRYDHKITRSQTRVWFLTTTGEEERTVPIHWQKYWLVTGDYQLRPPACWLISQAYLWTLYSATRCCRDPGHFLQQATATRINQTRAGPDSYTRNKSLCCAQHLRLEAPPCLGSNGPEMNNARALL